MAEPYHIKKTALDVINITLLPKELAKRIINKLKRERDAVVIYRVYSVQFFKAFPNTETQAVCTACGNDRCASVCFIY